MRKIYALVCGLFLAAVGCSANLASLDQAGDLPSLIQALQSITVADLDAATVRAQAAGDTVAATCYPVLKKYVSLGAPGVDKVAGAFDAFEKARVLRRQVPQGVPDDLKLACAALVQDERVFVLKMAAIAGAGAATGGAAPLIIGPAVPLIRP